MLVDQLEGTGGLCGTWQSSMQAGVFLHVLLHLLYICARISLLFFAVEILPIFVGIHGFMGNLSWPVPEKKVRNALVFLVLQDFLYTRAVFWQPWWLPACFQILCFIFTVIDDVTFVCVVSFLIWSSMLVVLVLIVLKSSVCWRRQCWRYSLYLYIYRIPYPENPLFSPSERSGLHRAPEIRELSFL